MKSKFNLPADWPEHWNVTSVFNGNGRKWMVEDLKGYQFICEGQPTPEAAIEQAIKKARAVREGMAPKI